MNKRVAVSWLVAFSLLLALSSCGGGPGGGVGEFKTVTVSAQSSTTLLESDVLTGNTCSSTGSTGGTFSTDRLPVTITSTVFPNFNGTPSPIQIDNYTITYTPANSVSPALPPLNFTSIGTTVAPGGSLTVQVPVVQDVLKFSLVNNFNLQPCSATMFTYFVTITFNGLEVYTGERASIQTSLNVAIADRTT